MNGLLFIIKYKLFNNINIIILFLSFFYKKNKYFYKKFIFFILSYFGYFYSNKFFIFDNFLFGKYLFLSLILFSVLTDIIEKSIYNFISYSIGFFGLIFLFLKKFNNISFFDGFLTFIFSFSFFYLIYFISKKIYKTEVFGMGDVILIPFLSFYCGSLWLIWTILISSVLGSIYGILKLNYLKLIKKNKKLILIPFIPFLYLGLSISHNILY